MPDIVPSPPGAPLSPRTQAILALLNGLLPAVTFVAGLLTSLIVFLQHDRASRDQQFREAINTQNVRRLEARKPYADKQLALFFETAQLAGKLVTLDFNDKDWKLLAQRFRALYWSELALVEDNDVEAAMKYFGNRLDAYEADPRPEKLKALQAGAYCLAQTLRVSLSQTWDSQIMRPDGSIISFGFGGVPGSCRSR